MAKKIEVQIVGDAGSLERAFSQAGRASHSFGSALGTAVKVGAFAAAGGIGLAIVATKSFVSAAADAQRVQAQTESQLKALGIAYKDHADHINDVITKTSELSGIDDEELQGSFNNIVRVTGDVNKALTDTALAADISRGKHIELATAASIVTKAQMGMVSGLKRMGIEIAPVTAAVDKLKESKKKYTVEEMKAAKAADLTATKQKAITELQKKFAGAADAYGKTAQGAADRLGVAWENVREQLGAGLLPVLTRVGVAASKFLENMVTELGKAHGFKAKLEVVWTGVKDVAQRLADAISGALAQVDWAATGQAIVGGVQKGLSQAKQIGERLAAIVSQTMGQVDWEKVGTTVGPAIAAGLVSGLAVLVSPGFWLRHWQEMGAIALAVIPLGRVLEIGGLIVRTLAKPFAELLAPLLSRGLTAAGDVALNIAGRFGQRLGLVFLDAVITAGRVMARLPNVIGGAIGDLGSYVAGKLGTFKTFVIKALAFDAIIHAAVAGATALGEGIVHGVEHPLRTLSNLRALLTVAITGGISAVAGVAIAAAESIGRAIADGVVSGASSLGSSLASALSGQISGALSSVKSVFGIRSPSRVTHEQIGKPLGEGVVFGYIVGSADLPSKMSESIRKAIDAGRAAVAAGRTVFSNAWSQLTQDALTAFDAATARMMGKLEAKRGQLTPSEKKLQALQDAHDEAARQQAIQDAQAAIDAATASGDDSALVAAQRQMDDAMYNEQVANLERQAAKEREAKDAKYANKEKELQAQRDLERRHFEEHLQDLEAQLEREGATHKRAQDRIIKLLDSYGVSYRQSGLDLGHAFAVGIMESAKEVEKSAAHLAQIVAKYLPHSPAERGALSELPNWTNYLLPGLVDAVAQVNRTMDTGIRPMSVPSSRLGGVAAAVASAGTQSSPGYGAVSTGGNTYNFSFPNYVGDKRELVDLVRSEFSRINKQNGGTPGVVF